MRTLRRRLDLPTVKDDLSHETAFAIFLPRRGTRRLYRVLAIIAGIGAGLFYANRVLADGGLWWTIALAALGGILVYVLTLMPAAVVHYARKSHTRLLLAMYRRKLHNGIAAIRRRAQRKLEEEEEDAAAWETLGVTALLSGERQIAASAFENACRFGDNGACKVNLSVALAETRDISGAADLLLSAADGDNADDAVRHNLGVLMSRSPGQGIIERIIGNLDRLRVPSVLSNLGAWELQRGDLDMAEHYFNAAIAEDPASVAARANLALVSYRRGDLTKAVKQLHEALELDPMDANIANSLGALVSASGRPMVAARILSRAAMLSPGSTTVELNRGAVRLALGQYRDALDSFTDPEVRTQWPTHAAHNSALALIGLDRIDAAREQLEAGLERDPDDADLLNNMGCVCWEEGDDNEAQNYFSQVRADAEHRAAALNLAAFEIGRGRTEQAMSLLNELKRQQPEPAVSFLRGLALLSDALRFYKPKMSRPERRRFFEALHLCVRPFNAVVDSETASPEARANLALYRYLRRDFDEAVEGFLKLTEILPEDGFIQFCAGTVLAERARNVQEEHAQGQGELVGRAKDDVRRARRHFERALQLDEVNADVLCNLGMCAYDLGDIEGALTAFRRMSQLEDSADSANNLAIVHAREGLQLQRRARATALTSKQREQQMLSQAQVHFSTALHYFQKALGHTPTDAVLHGNVGLAFMLRNRGSDVEAALRHWQRMLALGGKSAGKRYEELTALAQNGEDRRADFDEALMEFRSLNPRNCLVTLPPRLSGPRYALRATADENDWQLVSDNPEVSALLRSRDRLSALRTRLMRLSI